MKKLILVFLIVSVSLGLISIGTVSAQDGRSSSETLTYNDEERGYTLYIPPNYDASTAVPLVIALHGAGSNGSAMFAGYDFSARADAVGSIVVYPNAEGQQWGFVDTPLPANEGAVDDIGFINALITHMTENYTIDTTRLYVIGHSSGGLMTYRLRCELSTQLTAVVIIQATLNYDIVQNCRQASPMPTMVLLSTNDSVFPWDGAVQYDEDGVLLSSFSQVQTIGVLTSLNDCTNVANNADISVGDSQIQVIQWAYDNCPNNAEVLLFGLVNMDHQWPLNASITLGDGLPGTLEDAIWTFLINHPPAEEQDTELTPEPEATEDS